MKRSAILSLLIATLSFLTLFTSCSNEPDHVDMDCGIIKTQIDNLDYSVGSYTHTGFLGNTSSNFEEAAIRIEIDDIILGERNCFEFTPDPQIIETIRITSSTDVASGGIVYASGESLNELFNIHNDGQTYSIPEFINAQATDPLIFAEEVDEIILQLLNKPDAAINQAFAILFSFDDSETLNVEVSNFEVSN